MACATVKDPYGHHTINRVNSISTGSGLARLILLLPCQVTKRARNIHSTLFDCDDYRLKGKKYPQKPR